jgi:ABC-type uncharacterized transport system involved in gliding motility auxiliary subunit
VDRERFSSYLAVAGFVALAAGLSAGGPWTVLTALGVAAMAVSALLNFRAILAFSRTRKARYGTNALLMTVFFLAIVVIVQAIAVRNAPRFDLTRNQRYTLAPQTVHLLDGLDADVTVTAFFRRGSVQRQQALDLLELYTRRSPRMSLEVVDPDRRPHIADELDASYDEVVFQSGGRRRTVDRMTEEQFTNALVQITRGVFKTVCFVSGHGEYSPTSSDRTGYASAARALADQGYLVEDVTLLDVDEVPADCEVLVVAGPFQQFLSSETERIDLYLRRGGSVLFLLEPWIDLPNVEALLGDYGFALPAAEILEEVTVQDSDREFGPRWTKVLRYQPHPITDGFRSATFYHSARPVQIISDENDVRFDGSYLAISGPGAWGEVSREDFKVGRATRDGRDIAGPLPVAAIVERSYGDGSVSATVAVFGDVDFANNSNFGLLGNADIFLNTVAFLAGDEDLISIRAREGARDRVYITASQGRLIFAVCVVLLPLSVLGVGVSVFLRKREA